MGYADYMASRDYFPDYTTDVFGWEDAPGLGDALDTLNSDYDIFTGFAEDYAVDDTGDGAYDGAEDTDGDGKILGDEGDATGDEGYPWGNAEDSEDFDYNPWGEDDTDTTDAETIDYNPDDYAGIGSYSGLTDEELMAQYDSLLKLQGDSTAGGAASWRIGEELSMLELEIDERNKNFVPKTLGSKGGGNDGTGGTLSKGAGGEGPEAAAQKAVLDQIAALTKQIADLEAARAAEAAKPKVVGVRTVRKKGGIVETVEVMSDGSQGKVVDTYKDFGARDSVMKMFENTGLGNKFITTLMDTIDKVYEENIMPTDDQILNSIYNSEAYKTRFAANEAIKKRMAEGKGMPGDRLLTPKEYIDTEIQYREIIQNASLPEGFYDTQDDFTKLIENSISAAELTERVNIAKNILQNADQNIKDALKNYYGLSENDMVAYLLDKDKAFNLIDSRFKYSTADAGQMLTAAEVGGAASRAGMGASRTFAEEIAASGKAAGAEEAFQTAARNQSDYARLLGLYGETAGEEDLARQQLALAGGTDVALKTKKLASKERAKFATRSAIDRTSLLGRLNNPDV
jgi:hypothetical protein